MGIPTACAIRSMNGFQLFRVSSGFLGVIKPNISFCGGFETAALTREFVRGAAFSPGLVCASAELPDVPRAIAVSSCRRFIMIGLVVVVLG